MQSKSKLLKLHDAIYDLSKATAVTVEKNVLAISFETSNACVEYDFATEKDAITILDKCYEIMKG